MEFHARDCGDSTAREYAIAHADAHGHAFVLASEYGEHAGAAVYYTTVPTLRGLPRFGRGAPRNDFDTLWTRPHRIYFDVDDDQQTFLPEMLLEQTVKGLIAFLVGLGGICMPCVSPCIGVQFLHSARREN